jgi:hypothetical protein
MNVAKIQGKGVLATAPTLNQILQFDGTDWAPTTLTPGDILNNGQNGAVRIGSNDANSLTFETNNAAAMTIDSAGKVGIGTKAPSGNLSVNPEQYSTGTASQTTTTITGTGTTFTAAMVGSQLVFANGVSAGTITGFGGATSLTVSTSQSVVDQAYSIKYSGLNVTSTGQVGIGSAGPASLLNVVGAPTASGNYGLISVGNGAWDGAAAGFFTGSASGTELAINTASGFTGNLADFQVAGVSKFKVDGSGNLTIAGTLANAAVNWAAPGAIGATTADAGTFTSLASTGYSQVSGNFAMSGAGTFATGTGSVGLNGDTTIAAGKNLSLASGSGTFGQIYTGTATAASLTADSLTSGSIMSLTSSSTAASAGNTGLNIGISGANGTGGISRYGIKSALTSTGATSTNIAGYFSATGATNNYGLIVENGNVGIGTTVPGAAVDIVNGAVNSQLRLSNSAADATLKLGYMTLRPYGSAASDISLITGTSSAVDSTLRLGGGSGALNAATELQFYTASNTTTLMGTQRMTIDSVGKVGIGTTSPSSTLDVNGNINIPATTASVGIITTNGTPFIHSYGGSTNTFVGFDSGNFTFGGSGGNSGFGRYTLKSLTTGGRNTALGTSSLLNNSSGNHNTAVGWSSLNTNSSGTYNTAVGVDSLSFNFSGMQNTAVGKLALGSSNGDDNTAIGFQAGYTSTSANANTSGIQNTYVGADAGPGTAAQLSNSMAIGYGARVLSSNQVVLGNSSVTTTILNGNVGIGTTTPTSPLHVIGGANFDNYVVQVTGGNGGFIGTGFGYYSSSTVFANSYVEQWSSTSDKFGVKDLGLRRNSAGVLEVYDGVTAGGLDANRRDLLVRNITSSGNVGIGITNPTFPLEVKANGDAFHWENLAGTSLGTFGVTTGGGSNGWIALYNGGVQTLEILGSGNSYFNGGNVGIGTTTPAEKLSVTGNLLIAGSSSRFKGAYSNADSSDTLFQSTVANGSTFLGAIPNGLGTMSQVRLYNSSDADNSGIGAFTASASSIGIGAAKSGTGSFLPITLGTSGLERMRIDTAGNVGIGTTAPGSALEVAGQVKITGGTPGAGKVLTSDAAGLASWNTAPAGSVSGLTAASGTGTIDNTNYAQTWNWSTATTQSPMSLSANALTTGSLLNVTSSNATLNSTSGLLNVANTGASTTGMVARIQSSSAAGSGLTVLANGNVGIGTIAPADLFALSKAQDGQTVIGIYNSNAGTSALAGAGFTSNAGTLSLGMLSSTYSGFPASAGSAFVWNSANSALIFGTNNAEKLRIANTGYIGIGSTAPLAKLSVGIDGISATPAQLYLGEYNSSGGAIPNFVVNWNSTGYWGMGSSTSAASENIVKLGNIGSPLTSTSTWAGTQDLTLQLPAIQATSTTVNSTFAGKVGIGTTAPAYSLDVLGTFHTFSTNTLTTGAMAYLNLIDNTFNPASAPAAGNRPIGFGSTIRTAGTSILSNSTVQAGDFVANHSSTATLSQLAALTNYTSNDTTGTVNSGYASTNNYVQGAGGTTITAVGSNGVVSNQSTGNMTNAVGLSGSVANNGAGTITTAKGLDIGITRSAGTITNGYGLYVGNIQATNKWSVYANDATAPSYFAGNVGIGTTTPSVALEVAGQVKITGGTPGAGKVLTSDAAGLASWGSAAAGSVSGLSSATAIQTLANANFAQTWNWDTLSTQTALSLGSSTITSGKLLNATSTATGMTGALANFALSGNNVANTGTVLKSSVTGASSAAVPLMVTNGGTGLSLRVNDDGTDTDSTPFVINASGSVGIGTIAPISLLNLQSAADAQVGMVVENTSPAGSQGDAYARFKTRNSDFSTLADDNTNAFFIINNNNGTSNPIAITSTNDVYFGANVGIGNNMPAPTAAVQLWSQGFRDLKITSNSDNVGTTENSTILLESKGNTLNGLFGTSDLANGQYSGALLDAVYIEAKSNSNAESIQFVTGGTVGATNGTAKMTIVESGNIGIGTIAPSGKLSVNPSQYAVGTASQAGTATVTGSGTTFTAAMIGSQFVYANGVSAGTITAVASATSLTSSVAQTVASQAFSINYSGLNVVSTGLVGIGTTNPVVPLTLGATGTADLIGLSGVSSTSVSIAAETTSGGQGLDQNVSARIKFSDDPGLFGAHIIFESNKTGASSVPTTESMRLTRAGNLGIGTTVPAGILDVEGGTAAASTNGTPIKVIAQSAGTGNMNGGDLVLLPGAKSGTGLSGGVLVGTSTNPGWLDPNSLYVAGTIYASTGIQSSGGVTFGDGTMYFDAGGSGATGYIKVATNSTERMRIIGSGNVGIGTTAPAAGLDIATVTTASAIIVPRDTTANRPTAVNGMIRYNTTTNLFEYYQNAAWVNYTVSSDARLKTHVEPIANGLGIVQQLNPVFFDWDQNNPRAQSYGTKHQVGFLAQEVEMVLPEVVDKGGDSYRTMDYSKITAVLVAAVKEMYDYVLGVNDRVADLESNNGNLTKDVETLKDQNRLLLNDNAEMNADIAEMKADNAGLKADNAELKARLDRLEAVSH